MEQVHSGICELGQFTQNNNNLNTDLYNTEVIQWRLLPTPGASFTSIDYRKISNVRRTNSKNLNDSLLILHLSLPNLLKPGVK